MHIDFTKLIADLEKQGGFAWIANQVRPGEEYVFAGFLPEVASPEYYVEAGNMTVRSLMAGLVGMDAVYPPTGYAETESQMIKAMKIANTVSLTEQAQRTLQAVSRQKGFNGYEEMLNFYDKVVIQPHLDTAEWLRGQALVNHQIDWTFNDANVQITYARPANWDLPTRTADEAYDGVNSKFWDDVMEAYRKLNHKVATILMNHDEFIKIIDNPANQIIVDDLSDDGRYATLRKYNPALEMYSLDGRFTVRVAIYDGSAEVFDTTNPGDTALVPFMPDGKIMFVGRDAGNRIYRVGDGSVMQPETWTGAARLGYTHIAPTVEGGGVPGRWGRMYVPENQPWKLTADGVTNLVPVIETPKLTVIATG